MGLAARQDAFDLAAALETFDAGIELHIDTRFHMFGHEEVRQRGRDGAGHHPVHRFEHRHLQSALGADGGDLKPDIARADDGDARTRQERRLQRVHIGDGFEIENPRQIGARTAQLAHPRAGGQQQLVVGQLAAIGQLHGLARTVDRLGRGVQQQIDARFAIIGIGFQEQARPLQLAQQIGLGERRALIGRIGFLAHQGDGAGMAFGAQRLDGLDGGLTGANNDDFLGHSHGSVTMRGRR